MKDYHKILGVSKGASEEELKKAYRIAAKANHPDLHPKEEREKYEAKMREINEAYDALTKPQPQPETSFEDIFRNFRFDFDENFGRRSGYNRTQNYNIQMNYQVALSKMIAGGELTISLSSNEMRFFSGNIDTGEFVETVTLPKNTPVEYTVTLHRNNIVLNLRLIPVCDIPEFQIAGINLVHRKQVSVTELLTGASLHIDHPVSGKKLKFNLPAGVSVNSQFKLTGKGLTYANGMVGDMIVILDVSVPELSHEQKMLIKKVMEQDYKIDQHNFHIIFEDDY